MQYKKLEIWKNKLLDTGKRNRMINYKRTRRSTLWLCEPGFEELFQKIAVKENELSFVMPVTREKDNRMFTLLEVMRRLEEPVEVLLGDINTDMSFEDRQQTLRNLRSKARLALEEQGTNILYMVSGFIEWHEKTPPAPLLCSPLVLTPVSLNLESFGAPYRMKKRDDEIVINPILAFVLEHEYGIILPPFDEDKQSLNDYLDTVEEIIKKHGFRIIRQTSLGLLSFLKISMYNDLTVNEEYVLKSPIIRAMLGDEDARALLNNVPEDGLTYDSLKAEECFSVVDADSSQQDAILCMKRGVSFVMQGPPGTGKSQTITNCIAEALAAGKKVLFVSEKAAALQVVYKRLEEVGLSDFCLPLHNYRANKKQIIDEIGAVLGLKKKQVDERIMSELVQLSVCRDELNIYAEELHEKILPLGISCYDVYCFLSELSATETIEIHLNNALGFTRQELSELLQLVERTAQAFAVIADSGYKNWRGLKLGTADGEKLKKCMGDAAAHLTEARAFCEKVANSLKLHIPDTYSSLVAFCTMLSDASNLEQLPKSQIEEYGYRALQLNAEKMRLLTEKCDILDSAVRIVYNENVFSADLAGCITEIQRLRDYLNTTPLIKTVISFDTFKSVGEPIDALTNLQGLFSDLHSAINQFKKAYSIESDIYKALELCRNQSAFIKAILPLCDKLLEFDKTSELHNILKKANTLCEEITAKQDTLLLQWKPSIFSLDYKPILERYNNDYDSFIKIFNFKYYKDRDTLTDMRVSASEDVDVITAKYVLGQLHKIHQSLAALDAVLNEALSYLTQTDDAVIDVKKNLAELEQVYGIIKGTLVNKDMTVQAVIASSPNVVNCINARKALKAAHINLNGMFGNLYAGMSTDWQSVIYNLKTAELLSECYVNTPDFDFSKFRVDMLGYYNDLTRLLNPLETEIPFIKTCFIESTSIEKCKLSELEEWLNACADKKVDLNDIDLYYGYIEKCRTAGIEQIEEIIERGTGINKVAEILKKAFYISWLNALLGEKKSLGKFKRSIHDERTAKFIKLDNRQMQIARARVRERLISQLPETDGVVKATDEMGILQKELKKKRRVMALRKLFALIPNLLLRLKPCLMMSPLSVSYFLEADKYNFDIVIFDEASQVFPEDAIGAIIRSRAAIITGDSKQLPPTSFFNTHTGSESDSDESEDGEETEQTVFDSILEEASDVLPCRTLLWHYRSKHEHLIAFSNREIYRNTLITFPSVDSGDNKFGVEFVYVADGYYEGGGKNCNRREAEKCIELVKKHIAETPERSLGIIAFSEKQQGVIEEEIEKFRRENPQYDGFFDENSDEPFFVKNLENVQGDQRDSIIFSICYAKDKNGVMYMRFGPLGSAGGERRLNVAVTRAKCSIKLVASILPTDIDLTRTDSEGVRLLRAYIDFAMRGEKALKEAKEKTADIFRIDSFKNIVADFLVNKGYVIKSDVGCSEYRIDIAVRGKGTCDEYKVGIECDGYTYASARTARDRDRLRTQMLERAGWHMYRVWSTAWKNNPEKEKKLLIKFLDSVLETSNFLSESSDKNSGKCETATATESRRDLYGFGKYTLTAWKFEGRASKKPTKALRDGIRAVVTDEQPIHRELLYKRLVVLFTGKNVTASVRAEIDNALSELAGKDLYIDKEGFVRMLPLTPVTVRTPDCSDTMRIIEYISIPEIANALLEIIRKSSPIGLKELNSECAAVFGYEQAGYSVTSRVAESLRYLKCGGRIAYDGEKILLKEGFEQ